MLNRRSLTNDTVCSTWPNKSWCGIGRRVNLVERPFRWRNDRLSQNIDDQISADSAFAAKKKKRTPEAVFKKLDKNDDKKLSEEEYVGKKTGKKAEKTKNRFGKLDTDGDGSLTFEEFNKKKK